MAINSVNYKVVMSTHNRSINSVPKLRECLVHVDSEGLGEVLAVVVLAVGGGESLDALIRDVTSPPEKRGKSHSLLGCCGPYRLNLILLPPLHVGGAPLVIDVEECLARALGDGVNLLVVELVSHNPMRLRVKS